MSDAIFLPAAELSASAVMFDSSIKLPEKDMVRVH